MPLLLLLLVCGVAFAGFDLNDNHQIRGAGTTRSRHHQQSAADVTGYYLEHLDLGQWMKSRGDWREYDHYPIFLVATEGGGIRAAYFTASVLAAMEQKCPGFAQHVIAISSVSGGSVGASVFAAQSAGQTNMPHSGCNVAPEIPGAALTRARNVLTTDLLSPLLSASLFPDALQRILPLPIPKFDRARALEYALEDGWRHANTGCAGCDPEAMSSPVAKLYAQKGDAPRRPVPHLFLNTTEAGTGRSIPFATWDVGDLAIPERTIPGDVDEAVPHATLVPMQNRMRRDEVPLSTAAMLSARFPYLTPAAKLGMTGHYVDGGYFENSGTWLLSGVAQNLIGQRLDYVDGDKDIEQAVQNAVIVAIVIRSEPCTRRAENVGCDEEIFHGDADSTLNEMLSPLRALLATRDKRAEYSISDLGAVTALIQRLTGAANVTAAAGQPVGPKGSMQCNEILCSVALRFYNAPNAEVPLTWMLSSRARLSMDNAVNEILAENLAAPPQPAPQQGDRLQGPYREILCLLQGGKNMAACPSRPR
jgi:predicted acylesterase/phospholipase RssA